jgi:hypothetical protein
MTVGRKRVPGTDQSVLFKGPHENIRHQTKLWGNLKGSEMTLRNAEEYG